MREAAETRFKIMWDRRSRKLDEWKAYRDSFAPSRGIFDDGEFTDSDRKKKSAKRKNSAPMKIAEEFAAGMQSGLASPGRDWFSLVLNNRRLMTIERVKAWVGQCEEVMTSKFMQTNFYDSFVDFLEEQGIFGTAAMFIEEDDVDVVRFRTMTAGQYGIDADGKGRVVFFCRKLRYTAGQLAKEFGIEALPDEIRKLLEERETRTDATEYEICHLIQPNERYETDTPGPPGMAFQSLWWISKYKQPEFIRVSGYEDFPVVVGRWKTIGNDVYGRKHPGEIALDDAVTLQQLEADSRSAIERITTPPIVAPRTLAGKIDNRPNRITFYDPVAGQTPMITPLYAINFNFEAAEAKIQQLKMDIERAFYVDLFRMWTTFRRQGLTATQVNAEDQEKSYILAPVTMRQTSETLDPVIMRVFSILLRAGMFPPPPGELSGEALRIEYVSEFAMLQKRAQQNGIENLLLFTERLAQIQVGAGKPPEVFDRIDADEIIEVIGDMYGTKSGIILGDDAVAEIREERAAQMRQAEMMQMAEQMAGMAPGVARAAKDMGQTPVGEASALDSFAAAVDGGMQ